MATQTENVGLTQPAGTEKYSLDVNNENLAKIDAVLGELQEAVGTGSGGGLGDKVGNFDDTEPGTVFGDLNIIKDQTEQNGTDIAEAKTVANGNSDKLTALQTTASNTKTVVDVVNTNTETVKQNTETLKTTANGISAEVETINTNVSGNGTKLDTLANKADVISGQVQTANTNISSIKSTGETTATNVESVKTTVENVGGKVDTAISLLNELKTALANANTNIATLLTQSNGVKAIVSGQVTTPPGNPSTASATIPDTMNAEKVVVIATAHSTASNIDSGIAWVRDGHTVTFTANNKVISYQFIEFY